MIPLISSFTKLCEISTSFVKNLSLGEANSLFYVNWPSGVIYPGLTSKVLSCRFLFFLFVCFFFCFFFRVFSFVFVCVFVRLL